MCFFYYKNFETLWIDASLYELQLSQQCPSTYRIINIQHLSLVSFSTVYTTNEKFCSKEITVALGGDH